ncbi:MAG: sodium/solute symporter [Planctomycetia bacterium]|nr:sodium/solute symporter [Planctomycetia bacterium]
MKRPSTMICFATMLLATSLALRAEWQIQEASLPQAVARPFYGVWPDGAFPEETLYLLGGSFFAKSPNDGGVKEYSDQIVAVRLEVGGRAVVESLGKMPVRMAEGFSVVVPANVSPHLPAGQNGLFCLGGRNADGEHAAAFLFSVTPDKKARFQPLPSLPVEGSMLAGGRVKSIVYVLAGKHLFSLDLKQRTPTWQERARFPGKPRQQAAFAVQGGKDKRDGLFLFGGFSKDTVENETLSDAWYYDPETDTWSEIAPIPSGTVGAVAVPSGCESILFVGGYPKEKWDATRRKIAAFRNANDAAGLAEYMRTLYAAPVERLGWNRTVTAYHTVPNAYAQLPGELPLATCGSAVAFLGKTLVVAGGEDAGAHRTTQIQTRFLGVHRHFGWLNWTVLLLYLVSLLPIGFYFMRRSTQSSDDYFKGGGRIPWWVNGLSIYATMLSSLTFIAVPTMTYLGDLRYYPFSFMILVTAFIVIHFYIPHFRRRNLTCAYEYLEQRFNLFTRLFASCAFIFYMIMKSAVVMYLPSLVLSIVGGIDLTLSILLVGSITLVFCTIGGMEAVAWADFLQAVILLGSAVLVLVFLIHGSGGISAATQSAWSAGKLKLLDVSWDWSQPVLWVALFGGLAQHLTSYTSDQTIIQRYLTMTNTRDTNNSMLLNGFLSVLGVVLFYFIGTGLYTFYHAHPAAFDCMLPENDAVFPTFMVTQLPPGLTGLLVAAVFAATISTISGNFNSSAAAFVMDFFCRFTRHSKESRAAVYASLIATATTGLLAILLTLFLATLPDLKSLFDLFLTTIGVLTGGLCGLFLLGFFVPRVGSLGAIVGLVCSYAVNIVLLFDTAFGIPLARKPHPLLYAFLSLGTFLVVGILVSLLVPRKNRHVEK